MSRGAAARVGAGLALLVLAAAPAVARPVGLLLAPPARSIAGDEVALSEARLRRVRMALPRHGVVGYVEDSDASADPAGVKAYYLTQYALPPLVVARGPEHRLVLARVAPDRKAPAAFPGGDLVLIEDFGNGYRLLRNTTR